MLLFISYLLYETFPKNSNPPLVPVHHCILFICLCFMAESRSSSLLNKSLRLGGHHASYLRWFPYSTWHHSERTASKTQLLLLHVPIEVPKLFYSTYLSAFLMAGTKSLWITSPRGGVVSTSNASICVSPQRSFFQTAESDPGLRHSRLDNLGS